MKQTYCTWTNTPAY